MQHGQESCIQHQDGVLLVAGGKAESDQKCLFCAVNQLLHRKPVIFIVRYD